MSHDGEYVVLAAEKSRKSMVQWNCLLLLLLHVVGVDLMQITRPGRYG